MNCSMSSPSETIVDFMKYKQQHSPAVSVGWQDLLCNEIKDIRNHTDFPDEVEVDGNSITNALSFCNLLSVETERPSLGVEDEGGVLFEWFKKNKEGIATILSIVFDKDNIIFSVWDENKNKTQGVLKFSKDSLDMILPLTKKYFRIANYASRSRIR